MFPQGAIPLIPQKTPFVMVGDLVFANDTSARSNFTVTDDNVFTIDGEFQEGGLLENIAQTAAAHAGYRAQSEKRVVKPGFIISVSDLDIIALPKTGNILLTEVTMQDQINDLTVITGKVWCNDLPIVTCEMKILIPADE